MEICTETMIIRGMATVEILSQKPGNFTEEERVLHNCLCAAISDYYRVLDAILKRELLKKEKEINDLESD